MARFACKIVTKSNYWRLDKKQRETIELVKKWHTFYKEKFHVNPQIKIGFSNGLTHTAGKCRKISKTENIFRVMFSNHLIDQERYDRTVAHEVAHVFQFTLYPRSSPHGIQFQHVFGSSGYVPHRCHSYPVPRTKTRKTTRIYSCENCGQRYKLGLKTQYKIYSEICNCSVCGSRVSIASIFGVGKKLPRYLRWYIAKMGMMKNAS